MKVLLIALTAWGMALWSAQALEVTVTGLVRGALPHGATVVASADDKPIGQAAVGNDGKFRLRFDQDYQHQPVCLDVEGAFALSRQCIEDPFEAQNPPGSISGIDFVLTDQKSRRAADFVLIDNLIDSTDYDIAEARLFAPDAKRLGYFDSPQFFTVWSDLIYAALQNQESLRPATLDVAAHLEDGSDIAVAFAGFSNVQRRDRVRLFFNALQQGGHHVDGFPDSRSARHMFNLVIDIAALALREGDPVPLFTETSRFCIRKLPPAEQLWCLEAILSAAGLAEQMARLQPVDPMHEAVMRYLRNCLEVLSTQAARRLVNDGQGDRLERFSRLIENTFAQASDQQVRDATQNIILNIQSALAN